MPVYVTGAHVTLGDGTHKRSHSKSPGTLKGPFYFKHTCSTPYCCRTFFVIFSGLILVGTGTIMTFMGYKPSILLPWYAIKNNATVNETNSDPKVLGEPGPLRIMVYTGPVVMGVGFFGVMMAVVLFCEIKDRYLMAILPTKGEFRKIKKDMLYDIIIKEFRKNYFRGIEVPIKKEDQKKHSFKKWSLSLSGSGSSFISFARRHSHDLFKLVKRKHKTKEKWINATFPKHSTSDSWIKTSSLPNIKQNTETVELEILSTVNQNELDSHLNDDTKYAQMSTEETGQDVAKASGVDNLAYRESPSNKKATLVCRTGKDVRETLTTAVVHNESDHKEDNAYSPVDESITDVLSMSETDKNGTDLSCITVKDVQGASNSTSTIICDGTHNRGKSDQGNMYKTEDGDSVDALGMTSDTTSLTLSWEGDPLEWRDTRRNTEPSALFQLRLSSESNDDIMQTTTHQSTTTTDDKTIESSYQSKRNSCTFKTVIRVFHSEASLSKYYRFIQPVQNSQLDTLSLDSLELTDEMLKHFEATNISHI